MAMDFLALLRRDHDELERGLDELLVPMGSVAQIRSALDGVRLGLTAHAEAEDIVLYFAISQCPTTPELEDLVDDARAAHLEQESALAALVCAQPGTGQWRQRARLLRDLVRDHAVVEEELLVPALRELVPREVYDRLAGAFATERLRQLAMLQPSAPISIAQLAL
jgi:hypothetical protein